LSRISLALRSFFSILFSGHLPADIAQAFGYSKREEPKEAAAPAREVRASDGALQMLAILQRDARLVDFLMEDVSGYADDQIGAAVRNLHDQCRESLGHYVKLSPVIDSVEGTFTRLEGAGAIARDPAAVKLLGNVPADGKVPGGVLRHKGWRAERVELPPLPPKQDPAIVAPAEIEVE
jgi:hypothetical protein